MRERGGQQERKREVSGAIRLSLSLDFRYEFLSWNRGFNFVLLCSLETHNIVVVVVVGVVDLLLWWWGGFWRIFANPDGWGVEISRCVVVDDVEEFFLRILANPD